MKRSAAALVIMIVAGIIGYFAGAFLDSALGGAIAPPFDSDAEP